MKNVIKIDHYKLFILSILITLLFSTSVLAQQCRLPSFSDTYQYANGLSNNSSCDYYLCQNNLNYCEEDNYLEDFGNYYCEKFMTQTHDEVSLNAKFWLYKTQLCLIKHLENKVFRKPEVKLTCKQLQDTAFNSHFNCYLRSGFCQLKQGDVLKVFKTLKWSDRLNPKMIAMMFKIVNKCSFNKSNQQLYIDFLNNL
jgi:hypothetical protein